MKRAAIFALLILITSPLLAREEDHADAVEYFFRAASLMRVADRPTLSMRAQLEIETGGRKQSGSLQYVRDSVKNTRSLEITVGPYHEVAVVTRTQQSRWRTSQVRPSPIGVLLNKFLSPVPSPIPPRWSIRAVHNRKIDGIHLRCVETDLDRATQEYCFDSDGLLRRYSAFRNAGNHKEPFREISFNDFDLLDGLRVARRVRVSLPDITGELRVTELSTTLPEGWTPPDLGSYAVMSPLCEHEVAPKALQAPDPEYSEEARKSGISGRVILDVVVGTDGRPRDIVVDEGPGFGLEEKAIHAVETWHFQAARCGAEVVPKDIKVELNFRLY